MRKKNTTTEMMKGYIADSLLHLMSTKPYNDITIAEITKKAGVNRSTYYRNYNSKDEIVMYYYNRIIDEYLDSIASKQNMSMQVYLEAMFVYFLKYKDSLLMIHRAGVAHHILSALNALFISDDGKRPIEEVFRVYYHTGGIYNVFLLWFDKGMSISPKKLSEMSVKVLPKEQKPFLL